MDGTKTFLVTGGAGFIGSAVLRHLVRHTPHKVVVVDKLTYAGNMASLAPVASDARFSFYRQDITDACRMAELIRSVQPDVIMHLAAESHVDRSIDGAAEFIQTNIVGTFVLLQAALEYWKSLPSASQEKFRFHHISTDEVFGSIEDGAFTEASSYQPNSPYSASKAGSDHLVRAWHHTYGLPTLISNCSNNYGPYQFPEKLIPLMILNCMEELELPVYGTGANERDWLHVDDHVSALLCVAEKGAPGETYLIGGDRAVSNLSIVEQICDLVDDRLQRPRASRERIRFVTDRPGHDFRYAIDASRIRRELGWSPKEEISTGLARTVDWYLNNRAWWEPIRNGTYRGERLGVGA